MEGITNEQKDQMGIFHNKIVGLVDECGLSLPDVIAVMRITVQEIERLLELSVKAVPKKES